MCRRWRYVTTGLRMNTIAPASTSGGQITRKYQPMTPSNVIRAASPTIAQATAPACRIRSAITRSTYSRGSSGPRTGSLELGGDAEEEILSTRAGDELHADRQAVGRGPHRQADGRLPGRVERQRERDDLRRPGDTRARVVGR